MHVYWTRFRFKDASEMIAVKTVSCGLMAVAFTILLILYNKVRKIWSTNQETYENLIIYMLLMIGQWLLNDQLIKKQVRNNLYIIHNECYHKQFIICSVPADETSWNLLITNHFCILWLSIWCILRYATHVFNIYHLLSLKTYFLQWWFYQRGHRSKTK